MAAKTLQASGVLYSDRRNFYLNPAITRELWPSANPFLTILANGNVVTGLADPIFKQFEHRSAFVNQRFSNNGSTVTIPVDDTESSAVTVDGITGLASSIDDSFVGQEVEIWDSTLTTKKGHAIITSAPSATTVKLKAISANTVAIATIATVDNDVYLCLGKTRPEGDTAGEAWADDLKVVFGSTGISETVVEVTGTLYEAALRGYSNELARLRMEKTKEHQMSRERLKLFGRSVLGTGLADSRDGSSVESFADSGRTNAAGTKKTRTTMGLVTAIDLYGDSSTTSDNQSLFTITQASYKYSNFVDDMEKVFHYYPEDGIKYALCGPGAMSYWSKLDNNMFSNGKGGFTVNIGESQTAQLGFMVRLLETPHGVLALVKTPAFRFTPYNNRMIVISDENLSLMQYRAPVFKTNVKTDNDYDGEKDVYRTDEGVGMTLIESHKSFNIV